MGITIAPTFRLTANQDDITAAIRERFVSLRIVDRAGQDSDELSLVLADHDPTAPIALPAAGAELECWLGYDDAAESLGTYVVDSVELTWPPNQVRIVAKAAPLAKSESGQGSNRLMLQTKKTRSWNAGTLLGDMTRTIAQEHSLEAVVQQAMASIALPHVDQINESDMNLLTRLAQQYDGIAKPAAGRLVLARRGASRAASPDEPQLPTVPITPDMVSTGRMQLAKRRAAGSVTAQWRDTEEGETVDVTVGQDEPINRLGTVFPDAESAMAAAQAEWRRSQRGEQRLDISLPGDPRLMAEGRLKLQGFREGADGEWLITQVEHRLDADGYSCRVQAELPGS
ncbi:phage tail protein [Billgrantia pellis]|uniref:Phage tail protein n=1 Tax=Billgrantia pellis TaxID=2606936 RepID=A0A7V7G336_9GAMM|nr:contractile injection system protein, VgrG/Pvc8 family [Halomonas pellis]KAA0014442.1 phage tail protein [Halomonas pellis]